MRAARIVAGLALAPIAGAVVYVSMLALQPKAMSDGPRREDLAFTGIVMAAIALAFLLLSLLPIAYLVRRSANFRMFLLIFGGALWFGLSVGAFLLMGEGASPAVATGVHLLALGIPTIAVFTVALGKGPHA